MHQPLPKKKSLAKEKGANAFEENIFSF